MFAGETREAGACKFPPTDTASQNSPGIVKLPQSSKSLSENCTTRNFQTGSSPVVVPFRRPWFPLSQFVRLAGGVGNWCFRSVLLFRLFGVPVRMHTTWLLFPGCQFAALAGVETLGVGTALTLAVGFFASLLAHEFAHVLVARGFGYQTRSVMFFPLGAVAVLEDDLEDGAELWIALAGPAMSAGIALAAGWPLLNNGLPWWLNFDLHPVASYLVFVNALLALFNLLPCPPMDGGRAVRSLLALAIGRWRPACAGRARLMATRIVVRWISLPVAVAIIGHVLLVTHLWSVLLTMLLIIVFGELECWMLRDRQRQPPLVLNGLFLPAHTGLWRRKPAGRTRLPAPGTEATPLPANPRPITQPAT
jgi:Zn-dependent protease